MDDKLKNYIITSRKDNLTDDQIEANLVAAGWSHSLVKQTLDQLKSPSNIPHPPSIAPVSNMWDSFEHILLFITLYILAISMTMMFHVIIDHYYPAPKLDDIGYYYGTFVGYFTRSFISYYLAGLIVTYPIFSVLFLQVTKRTINNPGLRQLRARKILTYLTLVVTFLILIGQLINLVIKFIDGNTSLNFFLHLFATVTISGAMFSYYYLQVKHDRDALIDK